LFAVVAQIRWLAVSTLQYYTGQASGLAAQVNLPLVPLGIDPTPDTGPIRTATATRTTIPCTASVCILLIHADALCPQVVTSRLAPASGDPGRDRRVEHLTPVRTISG
jgi:hypothetical protein